jgi:hypothetical protein
VDLLEAAEEQLKSAQDELAAAQVAATEAVARREEAESGLRKLEAAVAALRGEPPPASPTDLPKTTTEPIEGNDPGKGVLSPEEWEKEQNAKRRKREKELEEQNPLAHVKCSGCGTKGSLAESYIQSPAGTPVRSLVCNKCNNQSF